MYERDTHSLSVVLGGGGKVLARHEALDAALSHVLLLEEVVDLRLSQRDLSLVGDLDGIARATSDGAAKAALAWALTRWTGGASASLWREKRVELNVKCRRLTRAGCVPSFHLITSSRWLRRRL